MELLERDADLRVLDRALADAGSGSGSVVLVGGEAGIGKTRLVQAFEQRHHDDARVLWGACDDLSTPRTLGPFHDLALQVGGALERAVVEGERGAVFDAALEAISGGTSPSAVVIEDVHWADGATLDVLKYLGRRIDRLPATLILTYREEEVPADHPLMLVIGDLPVSAVHRLSLESLSKAAVARLAADYAGSTERLFTVTRGNPFLVTEALLTSAGDVPVNVRDAVRTRASRLSPSARAVAEFLAVVPNQAELWLLEALSGFDVDALDECRDRGLIEYDASHVKYRHELVRGAMEESLPPGRRRALNALVLEALIERGSDVARIVHHARRAEDGSAIARYAPTAAREASTASAHREALAHFRIAVEYRADLPLRDEAQLLTDYAVECYFANEAVEGLVAAERAVELWVQIGDGIRHGDTLRWISRLHWWLGHGEQAIATGRAAIDALGSARGSKELAMAYSNLAQVFMLAQQAQPAEEWATKAISLARRIDDQNTLAHALNNLGSTRLRTGDTAGVALLEESLDIARRERFDDHVGRAYANLLWTALDYRRYDDAQRYAEDGLAYARNRELAGNMYYLTAERARLGFECGRWDQALKDVRWVLAQPEEPGITQMPALATLARLSVRRGDQDVEQVLDRAWRLVEPTGELQRMAPVAIAGAELAWLRSDPDRITPPILDTYRLAVAARQPWTVDEFAFWMWRAGADVESPAGSETPFAKQMSGDWREAADAWQAIGCPYERAVALMESEEPQDLLEALDILDGLGAGPAAGKLRTRLRRRGVRGVPRGVRRATKAHPAGLTGRQAEVLDLLAEGLTNSEIAERLYVSPKTVDHHVSAVLAKLGVSSRGEAATVARERGIV